MYSRRGAGDPIHALQMANAIAPAVSALASAVATQFGVPPHIAGPVANMLAKGGADLAVRGIRAIRGKGRPRKAAKRIAKATIPPALGAGQVQRRAAPVAVGFKRATARPVMQNLPNGDIVVSHTEYFADMPGSTGFAATPRPINPVSTIFPWLNLLARRFESYVFEELEFIYQPMCSTATAGSVILFVDYDVTDDAPVDKQQALGNRGAQRGAPWETVVFASAREDLHQRKSYFCGPKAATEADAKLHNVGNLFVCTAGMSGTTVTGELSVRYRIRLMTPQIGNLRVGAAVYMHRSGTTKNDPFGTLEETSGDFPATYTAPADVPTFTFTQPWSGLVTVVLTGTGLGGSVPSGTGTESELHQVDNSTTGMAAVYFVSCGIGETFVLTLTSTTITAADIYFYQGGTA